MIPTITNYVIVVLQQYIYDNLQFVRFKIIIASQVCRISAFLRIIWHPVVSWIWSTRILNFYIVLS